MSSFKCVVIVITLIIEHFQIHAHFLRLIDLMLDLASHVAGRALARYFTV